MVNFVNTPGGTLQSNGGNGGLPGAGGFAGPPSGGSGGTGGLLGGNAGAGGSVTVHCPSCTPVNTFTLSGTAGPGGTVIGTDGKYVVGASSTQPESDDEYVVDTDDSDESDEVAQK
jgi:hypothetical protein